MIRQLIPTALRRTVRDTWFHYELGRIRQRLRGTPDALPTPRELESLSRAWGNVEWAANTDYLLEVCQQARTTPGDILECGSGLTSVLMGLMIAERPNRLMALEHVPEWQERVTGVLRRAGLERVQLVHSPLEDYGAFEWYRKPKKGGPFTLVVCDGPPGATRGGRSGLLPVMSESLADGCLIVLDDAERPGEIETLQRWQADWSVQVECRGQDKPPARALVTYRPAATAAEPPPETRDT